MRSKVYYVEVKNSDDLVGTVEKFKRLLAQSKILDCIPQYERVAVKLHFGEEGNTGFVKPDFLRVLCVDLATRGASPFLTDTNTLYKGRRTNSKDHLALAHEHGFTPEKVAAEVIIADDSRKEYVAEVMLNGRLIKIAKIAGIFKDAGALVGVAHFKGHLMTGFGGALKNIGMGCASREGKLAQHCDVSPLIVEEKCIGCGACTRVCPVRAIEVKNKKALLDRKKCIGCASCIAACEYKAIDVEWSAGESSIQEKMVEYAQAVLEGKQGKIVFINFAFKITKECDCLAKDDPRIAPDIGIFISNDPVSVDKACYDEVIKAAGKDVFKEAHPRRDGLKQLQYACELGLGSLDYDIIPLGDAP